MKELRIGLVLYGGVSLAVYMNGIVTELWHLLRASRAREEGTVDQLDGNARVYADLLGEVAKSSDHELRVVVDAVAGTSAGGVNGAVLAKAVVDGGDASVLNRVWIEEADISKLRAEPADRLPWYGRAAFAALKLVPKVRDILSQVDALPGLSSEWVRDHLYSMITAKDGKSTLLNGSYFTEMIAKTFADMARGGDGRPLLPERASFDLFLTRTDLHGWPRHLPVSKTFHPTALYERTHAHVMHFRRDPRGRPLNDDFGLTYATRSTAGFPVAFAPISHTDIAADYRKARGGDEAPATDKFARDHLAEHRLFGFPAEHAWMVDGGVLDNKPFSHVISAIERKPADREVCRAVIYIEPDPETEIGKAPTAVPKPLEVGKGLYGLFRHEPIYEDLRRLQARNVRVREIKAILDADRLNAERAAEVAGQAADPPLDWPPAPGGAEKWRQATNEHAAGDALSGYPGYVVLKARSAAAVLADLICRALDYPYHSRHAYFVRQLVMAWLGEEGALAPPQLGEGGEYVLNDKQITLLAAFDVSFRLRRLRAMVQATNGAYQAAAEAKGGAAEARERLDAFKRVLADAAFAFETEIEDVETLREVISSIVGKDVLGTEIDAAVAENDFDPQRFLDNHGEAVAAIYAALAERFRAVGEAQNEVVAEALRQVAPAAPTSIMKAYATFAFIDLIAYPLMAVADIGDLFEVRTMRISPHDVPELAPGRPRLQSADLGAFRGFLDRAAREHDLAWGRLDGAHRLVALIMSAAGIGDARTDEHEKLRQTYLAQLTTPTSATMPSA